MLKSNKFLLIAGFLSAGQFLFRKLGEMKEIESEKEQQRELIRSIVVEELKKR